MFFEKLCPINDTAAILLESVQGEGGIYSLDKHYLQYIRNICDKYGILLIADEVQCGAMRTGSWWDIESKGIRPDMITFGKGIASEFPLAGVFSTSKIMNSLGKGYLGGTYGGNAISSAASIATIDVLNDPRVKENVNTIGKNIKDELKDKYLIKEIRQHGLMIAIEFSQNYSNPEFSSFIVNTLRENGILVLLCGSKGTFIRLLPPLLVSKEEIDIFIGTLKNILYEMDFYSE